jgi:hypothetical protein
MLNPSLNAVLEFYGDALEADGGSDGSGSSGGMGGRGLIRQATALSASLHRRK